MHFLEESYKENPEKENRKQKNIRIKREIKKYRNQESRIKNQESINQ